MEKQGMTISAATVKALRDETGAGFMECKSALTDADGDLDKAIIILRKRGTAQAAKRSGRSTKQGVTGSYIHPGGSVGVLVEINCESDFVARTDDFKTLVKEVAMHIAASSPTYVRVEDIPVEVIEREKDIFRSQLEGSNKPAQIIDKILDGKINSYYGQVVLLKQPSIRDPKTTVTDLVAATIAKVGENISIARFARFKVGEVDK